MLSFLTPKSDAVAVRVLVADDVALFRRQAVIALEREPDIEVMAEAPDGDVVVRQALELAPDVVVIGTQIGGPGAIRVAATIRDQVPSSAVALLVTPDDEPEILRAVRAGVTGFVARDASSVHLTATVRVLGAGRAVVSPPVARLVVEEYRSLARQAGSIQQPLPPPEPDPREEHVLDGLAEGAAPAEVADSVGVPVAVVHALVVQGLTRLHLHARTEVAFYDAAPRIFTPA